MVSNPDQPILGKLNVSGHQSLHPTQQQQNFQDRASLPSNGSTLESSYGVNPSSSSTFHHATGAGPYAKNQFGPAQNQVYSVNPCLYKSQPDENGGVGQPHPGPQKTSYQADVNSQHDYQMNEDRDQADYAQDKALQNSNTPLVQDLRGSVASSSPLVPPVPPSDPVSSSIQSTLVPGWLPDVTQWNVCPSGYHERVSTEIGAILPEHTPQDSPPITSLATATHTQQPCLALDNAPTTTNSQPHPSVREPTAVDAFGKIQTNSGGLSSSSPPLQQQQPGFIQTAQNPFSRPAPSSAPPLTGSPAHPTLMSGSCLVLPGTRTTE